MKTQILVIALILMVLWVFYHWNNNLPALSESQSKITQLKQEVQHYQALYQKRVEKDLEANQSAQISQLTQNISVLESNLAGANQAKELYSQKIGSLENQLVNLAKTKIKGQKEASELVGKLERNWKQDKENWKTAETDYLGKLEQVKKDQQQKERTIIGLNQSYDKLVAKFKEKNKNLLNKLDSYLENI